MRRILVIHRGSLGDFLLFGPSLIALRQAFPGACIEGLGRTEILSLVCPGLLDCAASAERATLLPVFEGSADFPEAEREYLSAFDGVLAYVSDPEGLLERNLSRLGVKHAIVRLPFPPEGERAHVSDYLMETIRPLLGWREERSGAGWAESGLRRIQALPELGTVAACKSLPFLRFDKDEIRQAESFLGPVGAPKKAVVAMHPGSGGESKCWPPERFEELARRLTGEAGCGLLLSLGPADERLAERMKALARRSGSVVAQCLSLRRLAALLSRCSAYVGNDSGVTHLAAAVGIPTVAIFGPTDPAVWAPVGPKVRLISANARCSPCSREQMRQCLERKCLDEISVEELVRSLAESISLQAPGLREGGAA